MSHSCQKQTRQWNLMHVPSALHIPARQVRTPATSLRQDRVVATTLRTHVAHVRSAYSRYGFKTGKAQIEHVPVCSPKRTSGLRANSQRSMHDLRALRRVLGVKGTEAPCLRAA